MTAKKINLEKPDHFLFRSMIRAIFKKRSLILYLVIILFYPHFLASQSPDKKNNLIVIDFKNEGGFSQEQIEIFTEFLRSDMLNTNLFTIIEKEHVEEILKEQLFQQSGCVSDSCAVEIGKLLTAEKIMTGTILNLKGQIFINLKIIDVKSGKIDYVEFYKSENRNDLALYAKEISLKISAGLQDEKIDSVKVSGKKSRASMVWRSALLPGLGHIYNEQWAVGFMHMGIFTGLVVNYFQRDNRYLEKRGSYPSDELRYQKNVAGVIALSYYFLQLTHAYASGISTSNDSTQSILLERKSGLTVSVFPVYGNENKSITYAGEFRYDFRF